MADGTGWAERYLGGSEAAEAALIDSFVRKINELQDANQRRDGGPVVRAFHGGTMGVILNGEWEVLPDIPADLAVGPFDIGGLFPAIVRFSSASANPRHKIGGDLRGVAIRVNGEGGVHDFLLTSGPVSHARNVEQFMASAMAGTSKSKLIALLRILFSVGPMDTPRMIKRLRSDTTQKSSSLARQRFWSRVPFAIGPVAVKFVLVPVDPAPGLPEPTFDFDRLRTELIERLRNGPAVFEVRAQRFVDEQRTPIEDASIEWTEAASPPVPLARLTLPPQDIDDPEAVRQVDALAFNPWNTLGGIRPLGNSNRARQRVYASSVEHRQHG